MSDRPSITVLCNGAEKPSAPEGKIFDLDYRPDERGGKVKLGLPGFHKKAGYLPERVLDLLEIAAYVFCADRSVSRGRKDLVEYHSWSRSFRLVVRVRDFDFWTRPEVKTVLNECLSFTAGDREWLFEFQPGHDTSYDGLFQDERFLVDPKRPTSIVLFSGGLDSLVGAIEKLSETNDQVCLVSHRSQPSIIRTQDALAEALKNRYPQRVTHYAFDCTLSGTRAREESQRSRGFLYSAIAYGLATAYKQEQFHVCENGVTSMNLPRRNDMFNGRTSRTTHPKTLGGMEKLFRHISGAPFDIATPFLWITKADLFRKIRKLGLEGLVPSAVSCSRTFKRLEGATHCGECYQCVDRRIAAYATGAEDLDHPGLYARDIVTEPIAEEEARTLTLDYIRQASKFRDANVDYFYDQNLADLSEIVDFLPFESDQEAVKNVWELHRKWGHEASSALARMRGKHDDPFDTPQDNSLLAMVSEREYMKSPRERLIEALSEMLTNGIQLAFQASLPDNERRLNDQIEALLNSREREYRREHPSATFSTAAVIPDHTAAEQHVLIEAKYVRENTRPSKVTDQMASDIVKYPDECHILFVVFDPEHQIRDEDAFRDDIEAKGHCTVCIVHR